MSNPRRTFSPLSRAIILVLLAFASIIFYPFATIIIVPIIIYYLWDNYDKRKDLERRVADLENCHKSNPTPA
jgi:hypothetical protein